MNEPTSEQIKRLAGFATELLLMAKYDGPFDAYSWSKDALGYALKESE